MTAEVYAARGERHLSTQIDQNLPKPLDWVDRKTGGGSVVVIGQGITDPTGIWETEFFNKSIRKMWSIDGTAARVGGPVLTPDLAAANGRLWPPPDTQYALALNGVELQGRLVKQVGQSRLYRLDGGPLNLAAAVTGVQSDGWMAAPDAQSPAMASYTRVTKASTTRRSASWSSGRAWCHACTCASANWNRCSTTRVSGSGPSMPSSSVPTSRQVAGSNDGMVAATV